LIWISSQRWLTEINCFEPIIEVIDDGFNQNQIVEVYSGRFV